MSLTFEHVTVDARGAGPLAATVLHGKEHGAHWRTLADPEGNEVCATRRSVEEA